MKRIFLLGVVAAPLLLAGCAGESIACGSLGNGASLTCMEETADVADSGDDLWGRAFTAQHVTGTAEAEDLMGGVKFIVTFEKGSIGAYAACNHMGADLELVDGTLVTDMLFSTEMACQEPLMAHDQWIADLLQSQPQYSLDGDTLTLTSGDITVELVETEPLN